jgi:hypothetical protein
MTGTLLIDVSDEDDDEQQLAERDGVLYAEEAIKSHDGTAGVAIQYAPGTFETEDEETEFVEGASLVGFYEQSVGVPFKNDFPDWVNSEA